MSSIAAWLHLLSAKREMHTPVHRGMATLCEHMKDHPLVLLLMKLNPREGRKLVEISGESHLG